MVENHALQMELVDMRIRKSIFAMGIVYSLVSLLLRTRAVNNG